MSAVEDRTIDVFGATLTRRGFVKGGGSLVVGLSLVGAGIGTAIGAGTAKAEANTVDPASPSSWLEIQASSSEIARMRGASIDGYRS